MNSIKTVVLESYEKYNHWRESHEEEKGYRIMNFLWNLFLSFVTVLPLIYQVCTKVHFSYEVNDDSAITQILNGSYTGTPDAHAVFLRYPLSLIIKVLYEHGEKITWFGKTYEKPNWYIITFVVIETIAMIAVLFRLLNYFNRNRILISALFAVGFMKIWFPCFSRLTFSTVGAFVGCMALLFFVLESEEEAWKPWNILILCFLILCAFSLRKQCFLMIAPFMVLEFIRKYHVNLLKKATPWILFAMCGLTIFGSNYMHTKMYSSQGWKRFLIYNHARAYMQDYGGFPGYEAQKEFYDAHNISAQERISIAKYRYCLIDDANPQLIEDMYAQKKASEPKLSMLQKAVKSKGRVKRYLLKSSAAPENLKYVSLFMWLILVPVVPLTIYVQRKRGLWHHLGYLFTTVGSGVLMGAEWVYLAINGRFPQRVEETIRLVMLTVGFMILCQYLKMWKDAPLTKIHPAIQVIATIVLLLWAAPTHMIQAMDASQVAMLNQQSDKAEIIEWCSKEPDNLYILDTNGVVAPLRPTDNYDNNNWYVSGSWLAYSPLYKEKLAMNNLTSLASETLKKDNVYVITKKEISPTLLFGLDEDKEVEVEKVQTICTQTDTFYTVYQVKKYVIKK